LHLLLHQGDRDSRQIGTEGLETSEQRAFQWTEKPGNSLHVENVDQLVRRPSGRLTAKRLVGHLDQRGLVMRVLDHAIQFCLLPPLLRCLQLLGSQLQLPCQENGPLGHQGNLGVWIDLERLPNGFPVGNRCGRIVRETVAGHC